MRERKREKGGARAQERRWFFKVISYPPRRMAVINNSSEIAARRKLRSIARTSSRVSRENVSRSIHNPGHLARTKRIIDAVDRDIRLVLINFPNRSKGSPACSFALDSDESSPYVTASLPRERGTKGKRENDSIGPTCSCKRVAVSMSSSSSLLLPPACC